MKDLFTIKRNVQLVKNLFVLILLVQNYNLSCKNDDISIKKMTWFKSLITLLIQIYHKLNYKQKFRKLFIPTIPIYFFLNITILLFKNKLL